MKEGREKHDDLRLDGAAGGFWEAHQLNRFEGYMM